TRPASCCAARASRRARACCPTSSDSSRSCRRSRRASRRPHEAAARERRRPRRRERGRVAAHASLRQPGHRRVPARLRVRGGGGTRRSGGGKGPLRPPPPGRRRPALAHPPGRGGARAPPPARRRDIVGLATPELAFYEEFTGAENLTFAAEAKGLADPARTAAEALAFVGLGSRAGDRVGAFSSGMKQRLRLAFALLHKPPILLLDEPGSHLDDAGRDAVRDVVARQAARGLVLLATNDPLEIQLAERRLKLHGHRLGDPA